MVLNVCEDVHVCAQTHQLCSRSALPVPPASDTSLPPGLLSIFLIHHVHFFSYGLAPVFTSQFFLQLYLSFLPWGNSETKSFTRLELLLFFFCLNSIMWGQAGFSPAEGVTGGEAGKRWLGSNSFQFDLEMTLNSRLSQLVAKIYIVNLSDDHSLIHRLILIHSWGINKSR